jgi:apolipoprotein N-acyltransferase
MGFVLTMPARTAPVERPEPAPFAVRWATLLAVLSGLVAVGAFPRYGIWALGPLSVAMFSVAVDRRRARTGAWLGYLFGLAFFVPLLWWTSTYVGPVAFLLSFAEAGFFAAMGAALTSLQRRRFAPFWIGTAWVAQEALRDRLPFGGFPWGRLAFSQAASPLKWFAAIGGAPLVTGAVGLAGGSLAIAIPAIWTHRHRTVATGLAGLVAVPLVGLIAGVPLRSQPERKETIALIQGSVPDLGLAFEQRAGQVLDNHITQTLKLAREIKAGTVARPSLVVWPEDSSDLDPLEDPTVYQAINSTVQAVGAPILVGAILNGPGPTHRRNVGILWSPTSGPGAQYTKRHPVPFAEYIPLRSLARKFSSDVDLVTQDMVKGKGNGLLTGGPYPIGDVICFEVAYDGLVRSSVEAGAQLLVVQTNNATFGRTPETYQQLAMSQLRAVEHGRTVVQVATTGKSAVIAPDGHIQAESGRLYTPAIIDRSVSLSTSITLADRLGWWPELVLSLLALVALVKPFAVRWTHHGPAPDEQEKERVE